MKKPTVYLLILITAFCGFLLPNLFTTGIFGDGLIYAVVSRNLAIGKGDWWNLYYSDQIFSPFAEHPPLLFWIESMWFRFLGDHSWTEKSFSLLLGLVMAVSMRHFWLKLPLPKTNKQNWWLSLLLWILVPSIHWAYPNNMLENLLVIFTSWAVWKGYTAKNSQATVMVGLLVLFAFYTKGVVGLFPFAVFVLRKITLQDLSWKHCIWWSTLSVGVFLAGFGLSLLEDAARISWQRYFETQLFATLGGERLVQDHIIDLPRYYILKRVFTELFNPLLVLGILTYLSLRLTSNQAIFENKRLSLFFLLVALSATLPLMISPKQHSFYLIPAIPWFIFSLTILIINQLVPLFQHWSPIHWSYRLTRYLFGVLLLCTVTLCLFRTGKTSRDEQLLNDISLLVEQKKLDERIGISNSLIEQHSLHAYLMRYHHLSLYPNDSTASYWLSEKEGYVPQGYQKQQLPLTQYELYMR